MAKYQTGKHLEAFILLYLSQSSAHGGSVLQWLHEALPNVWTIDSGRVYRVLRELEESGALESHWVTEDIGAPLREYTLTDFGKHQLALWRDEISVRRDSLSRFLSWYEAWLGDQPQQ
jgi:DNA-binding PadR family transcriptional regulator